MTMSKEDLSRNRQRPVLGTIDKKQIEVCRASIRLVEPSEKQKELFQKDYQTAVILYHSNVFMEEIVRIRWKWGILLDTTPLIIAWENCKEWHDYFRIDISQSEVKRILKLLEQQEALSLFDYDELRVWELITLLYDKAYLNDLVILLSSYQLPPRWLKAIMGMVERSVLAVPGRLIVLHMVDPLGQRRHYIEISSDTEVGNLAESYHALSLVFAPNKASGSVLGQIEQDFLQLAASDPEMQKIIKSRGRLKAHPPAAKNMTGNMRENFEMDYRLWKLKKVQGISWTNLVSEYLRQYQGDESCEAERDETMRTRVRRFDDRIASLKPKPQF